MREAVSHVFDRKSPSKFCDYIFVGTDLEDNLHRGKVFQNTTCWPKRLAPRGVFIRSTWEILHIREYSTPVATASCSAVLVLGLFLTIKGKTPMLMAVSTAAKQVGYIRQAVELA